MYILYGVVSLLLLTGAAGATSVQRLSFEELTDSSELIVSGNVTRSWTAWDVNHKYIWTHYEVSVTGSQKGAAPRTVEIAEPGGTVDSVGMTIAGSVRYTPGENVVVFAQRMPNGYLRTAGWGQGKYSVDRGGLLRADTALRSVELVDARSAAAPRATALPRLEGMSVRELSARIALRVRTVQSQGKVQ